MQQPSIQRLIEFQKLLNSFAEIERIVHIKRHGKNVLESDTEHSYNLAMMAWFLADYFPHLRKEAIIQLALVHDLVEIHAGDTFVFADQELLDSKASREAAAQQELAKDWPDFESLHQTIAAYESLATAEANFVYALDKIMPMFAVYLNSGMTWQDKNISLEQLNEEKRRKMSVSPELLRYWDELYSLLLKTPELFPS